MEGDLQISNENLLAISQVVMEDLTPKPKKKGRKATPRYPKQSKPPSVTTRAQEKQEKRVTRGQANTTTQHVALPTPAPRTKKKTKAKPGQSGPKDKSGTQTGQKGTQSQVSNTGPRVNPENAEGTPPAAKGAKRPTSQIMAVHPSPTVQELNKISN